MEVLQGKYRFISTTYPAADSLSDNDPLVAPVLRLELKTIYPSALVYTFTGAGHFPYLIRAEEYARIIDEFFSASQ
jgi:pimeloyl-ACP methyl ester carboxylesterase